MAKKKRTPNPPFASATHAAKGEWVRMTRELLESDPEVLNELFALVQRAYEPIGGHLKIRKPTDLLHELDFFVAVDIDDNPDADAFYGGKVRGGVDKRTVSGQDGSKAAKQVLLDETVEALYGGTVLEGSGGIAHVLITRYNAPWLGEADVRRMLPGKQIKWFGEHPEGKYPGTEGWFSRKIGRKVVTKIMFGLPRAISRRTTNPLSKKNLMRHRQSNPITLATARLKRQKKWPKQMQQLYDYFVDESGRGAEILRCCSGPFFTERRYMAGGFSAEDGEALEDVLEQLEDQGYSPGEFVEILEGDFPALYALLEKEAEVNPDLFSMSSWGAEEEQPAWMFMDGRKVDYGWLIHFSDTARDIAAEGFCRGVPYPDALALTTHLSDIEFDTEGYNFAYEAEAATRYGIDRGRPKYGKHAVLFQAPYMLFDHYGDKEPQAVFWGPSARDIIEIDFDAGREPALNLSDTLALISDSGELVALYPDDADSPDELAEDLQEEHGGEWTDRIDFENVGELLEWLEGPPIEGKSRLSLFDPVTKPICVIKHRRKHRD